MDPGAPDSNHGPPGGARGNDLPPCGLGRRLLVMLYDGVLIVGLLFIAAALALPVTGTRFQAARDPGYTLFLAGVWFAYLGYFWTRHGQTLGMRAWRVRLLAGPGARVSWAASALRFAVALLAILPAGAGYWWALIHPRKACWHDLASGTRLVRMDPRYGPGRLRQ